MSGKTLRVGRKHADCVLSERLNIISENNNFKKSSFAYLQFFNCSELYFHINNTATIQSLQKNKTKHIAIAAKE